jgi:lysosomal alpha-mannosidase
MNLLTDRAQGGTSLEDGQIEFLIHRRLLKQDFCLFREPLNEIAYDKGLVVRGTHTLFFESTNRDAKGNVQGSSTLRSLVQMRSMQPQISFISVNFTFAEWIQLQQSQVYLSCFNLIV